MLIKLFSQRTQGKASKVKERESEQLIIRLQFNNILLKDTLRGFRAEENLHLVLLVYMYKGSSTYCLEYTTKTTVFPSFEKYSWLLLLTFS